MLLVLFLLTTPLVVLKLVSCIRALDLWDWTLKGSTLDGRLCNDLAVVIPQESMDFLNILRNEKIL